jgi:hypothetical protein
MRQILAIPILICGLALAAGCGKTSGPSVPAANGSASASPSAASGGYSAFFGCLRQHGISVPDPAPSSPGTVGEWVDQQSAQDTMFDPAAVACQSQLPASDPNSRPANHPPSAQELEQVRTYAVCMRAHGIPMSDPDPTTGDTQIGGRLEHVTRTQLNNDPGYKAARQACKSKLPGGPEWSPNVSGKKKSR